jgi:hypothetical protein
MARKVHKVWKAHRESRARKATRATKARSVPRPAGRNWSARSARFGGPAGNPGRERRQG